MIIFYKLEYAEIKLYLYCRKTLIDVMHRKFQKAFVNLLATRTSAMDHHMSGMNMNCSCTPMNMNMVMTMSWGYGNILWPVFYC